VIVLKRLIALIWTIEVTLVCNLLHQRPRETTLIKLVSPLFLKTAMRVAQIIGRNSCGKVMGDVDVDVVAEEFHPTGIIAVNSTK
jgi:hypothetical protein